MLISCPKCDFSQPEDRYCAKCGVDMASFQAPKPPLLKRIARHPLFPVIIIALSAGAFYLYSQNAQEQALRERVEYLTGGSEPNSTGDVSRKEQDSEASAATVDPAPPASPSNGASSDQSDTLERANDAPENASLPRESFGFSRGESSADPRERVAVNGAKASKSAEPPIPSPAVTPVLNIIYAEVSNAFLESLIISSNRQSQFTSMGIYGMGHVQNLSQLIGDGRRRGEVRVLQETRRPISERNLNPQWFSGQTDPTTNLEVGLATHLALSMPDEQGLEGEIGLFLSLPDPQDPAQIKRDSFIADFVINDRQSFFLMGMLPNRVISEAESALYSDGVLEILLSPSFQQQDTDFAIFILNDTVTRPATKEPVQN